MQQHFYAGIGMSQQPTFLAYIQEGSIYGPDASGQQVAVGVTSKVHEDLKKDYDDLYKRCQEYYDKLVELGVITPKLTGDDLIKAQSEELANATKLIKQMEQNQQQLLSVIQNMTQVGQVAGEAKNELATHDSEPDTGAVSAVEDNDSGSKPADGAVSKHKARFAAGHNRKKSAA